jgi:hypothetical protein
MLNPLDEWKPEHRAGLLVASAGGAALGVAVGFWTRSCSRLTGDGLAHIIGCPSFTQWAGNPEEMIFWALVGAIVVGAAIYCFRTFSK